MWRKLLISLIFLSISSVTMGVEPLRAAFPSPPPAYEVLHPGTLVADAQVGFSAVVSDLQVKQTNGYTVTDPYGNTFVVDNIESPTYAFYGNYIETSDNLTVFDTPKINSTVYVETINFGN